MLNHSLALGGTEVTRARLTVPHLLLPPSPGLGWMHPQTKCGADLSLLVHYSLLPSPPPIMWKVEPQLPHLIHKLLSMVPDSL